MARGILSLLKQRVLLGDGAMGTQLQERGLSSGQCLEEFNTTQPEIVQGIYKDYFDAGSDIIETNSFGGNRSRLALHGMEDRVYEFNRRAAELAVQVRPEGKFVAGSVGPTGEVLQPLGTLSEQEAYDGFAEQISALADGGVDAIFIETMMALEEIAIAIRAAKDLTSLPVSATMTFEIGKAGPRTAWGVSPEDMVSQLADSGVDIIGANCGQGFEEMAQIVDIIGRRTDKFVLAQANAGMPVMKNGKSTYNESPESMESKAMRILESGVNIIGGCCGTGPEHIKALRNLVDEINA